MIKCENLSFAYGKDAEVLRDITFSVKRGERVGIIGANGAGKSTILRILLGLEKDYRGMVSVGGMEVHKKNYPAIRKTAGYMFQDAENQLFMPTAREDVSFALINYGYDEEYVTEKTNAALQAVGIAGIADKPTWKMSGGEKKLVCIAVMLAAEPEIVIMDEPTNSLDPYNRKQLIDAINSLDNTTLIASHDLDMILDTCERALLLSNGRIVADGNARDILTDKELLERHRLLLPLSCR